VRNVDEDPAGERLDSVRAKYREERDKRLSSVRAQILELSGELARYVSDLDAEHTHRDPIVDDVDVIVVGGGYGGLLCAAMLRERGVRRVRLIEKGADVGGVWYWNKYPGARCDVESYIYMPLLSETGYVPSEKYAGREEIYGHARRIAERYDLYDLAIFETAVTGAEWNHRGEMWLLDTDRGDSLRTRFLVLANGPLNSLRLPSIDGITKFAGRSFHTSRWDYDYTGKDLENLSDKAVAVVGTGASALQCVPYLAEASKSLHVFQRTPATVGVRGNRVTDEGWAASLKPGWQDERMLNFTAVTSGVDVATDLVDDGWTHFFRAMKTAAEGRSGAAGPEEMLERADLAEMDLIRSRIDSVVADRDTAEALKPYFRYLCKRPGFHDEYLQAFNRPNVFLVDTAGRGIERMWEGGVVVQDKPYAMDCVVFATGFEWATSYTRRIGFDVKGKGGAVLSERWDSGIATLHGLMTTGFPNLLIQPGQNAQSAFGANAMHTLLENAQHIAYVVATTQAAGANSFELTADAEAEWVARIKRRSKRDLVFLETCTPGRFNNQGAANEWPAENVDFGDGALAMFSILRQWRETGAMPGLRPSPAASWPHPSICARPSARSEDNG
jgi:cation diffusion facilitator CzcD-associated flavoprotein CzcO